MIYSSLMQPELVFSNLTVGGAQQGDLLSFTCRGKRVYPKTTKFIVSTTNGMWVATIGWTGLFIGCGKGKTMMSAVNNMLDKIYVKWTNGPEETGKYADLADVDIDPTATNSYAIL